VRTRGRLTANGGGLGSDRDKARPVAHTQIASPQPVQWLSGRWRVVTHSLHAHAAERHQPHAREPWESDPLKSTKMTCVCSRRASGHSIPIERCSEKYLLSHSACWAGPIQHDARKRCGRGNFSSAKLQYFGARLMFLARAM